MGWFQKALSKWAEPDYVVPLTSNVNNYVYLDPQHAELDIFKDTAKFIAREFTKIKLSVSQETANRKQIQYLLNLAPNKETTANGLLYEFAYSLLRTGRVWYRIEASDQMPRAIYVSRTEKAGYTAFTAEWLRLNVPDNLIEQYTDLIGALSTQHSSNVMEIQSQIKAPDGTPEGAADFAKRVESRLKLVDSNIKSHGAFFTNPNEATKDHANLTQPDGTALADLRALIYEQLHISPKMLDGSYTETDYRAFYATHLQPIGGAFEEMINRALFTREQYIAGSKVEAILDLLQFATLESFTKMAKEAIYSGYQTTDELRHSLGKEPYPDGYGNIIFSNKNAVALNNAELNSILSTGGQTNETPQTDGDTSSQDDSGQQ